ncbi:hypothetical protein C2845_PM15G03960 [Panicum miliaceum]|uniref:Uncharacterized protein n=1 Tax=Panicum miliaceum TaxID=4540 RepID=A0A3L6Q4N6_PANMI|nr:hypothetical protein C2845_PM15G03960 [Panicum miliaceum]
MRSSHRAPSDGAVAGSTPSGGAEDSGSAGLRSPSPSPVPTPDRAGGVHPSPAATDSGHGSYEVQKVAACTPDSGPSLTGNPAAAVARCRRSRPARRSGDPGRGGCEVQEVAACACDSDARWADDPATAAASLRGAGGHLLRAAARDLDASLAGDPRRSGWVTACARCCACDSDATLAGTQQCVTTHVS